MAFACHFDFEAKEKSEERTFKFSTEDGLNWCIKETWQMRRFSKREGLLKYHKNRFVQLLSFNLIDENNLPSLEDRYYVELRIFNPIEPFLGFIDRGQEIHLDRVFEVAFAEYVERFYLDNEQRRHFRCNMNFYPLSHSQFISSVPLFSYCGNGIISVKEEQMRTALEFLSKNNPNLDLEYFSDIDIHCDSETFRVSRNLLAERSLVFRKILKKLANRGSITVTDVTHGTLHEMLHFIHAGHLAKRGFIDIKDLFKAADLYKVNDLKDICANYLDNIDCPVSDYQDSEVDIELNESTEEVNFDNLVIRESADYKSPTNSSKIGTQEQLAADDIKRAIQPKLSKKESTDNSVLEEQNRILKQDEQAENSTSYQISKISNIKNSASNALTVEHELSKQQEQIENRITSTHERHLEAEEITESAISAEHSRSFKTVTFSTSITTGHSSTVEEVFSSSFSEVRNEKILKRE